MPSLPTRPCLISTIPRSGTWRTKYFFRIYGELLAGNANPDVLALHANVTNGADNDYLLEFGVAPLLIDHFACPGFTELGIPEVQQWWALVDELGARDFHEQLALAHRQFQPQYNPESRIAFICRNPFELQISGANAWDKLCRSGSKPIPAFSPQWPVNPEIYRLEHTEDVFGAIINSFRASNSIKAYIIQLQGFVFMQRHYPENVLIVPYEEAKNDPVRSYTAMVRHLGLGAASGDRLDEYVAKALALTEYDAMKEYERKLGQPISQPPLTNRLREEEKSPAARMESHMPAVNRKPWQELFSPEDFRYVITELENYGLSPECIGQEFARELRSHAAPLPLQQALPQPLHKRLLRAVFG